jgi:Zn-finger nucleic acid-binding protein
MAERQNIEIDYCPQCRGVWLDRGELDKIIERSQREEAAFLPQGAPPNAPQPVPPAYPQQPYGGYGESSFGHGGGHHGDNHGSGHGGTSKGHGGFLKRLFD